ncbi:MAG: class I SAM-dependent methyltransferase [Thermoanaerobaculia bacterium]|nr:class I SAM-dependent methyltransferase [Thermoanaerobaculia bacterium]
MQSAEYDRMFALEGDHWWFVGRRVLALDLLDRFAKSHPRCLDLGCGTGVVSQELARRGSATSLDMSPLALGYSRRRGLERLVRGDAEAMPFGAETFDAVVSLDLFEHLASDRAGIGEAYRVLRPGGVLVLSVPAMMSLWGPHDVALMHHRRYSKMEVVERLQEAGFRVRRCSYSVCFLYPIVRAVRALERRRRGEPRSSLRPLPGWLNWLLTGIQRLEAALLGSFDLPWGSSVVAVAERRPDLPAATALPHAAS